VLKAACFTVNPFAENTWLVYAPSGEAVVFDPGFSKREEEKAFELFIEKEQLSLVGMVNTHCHIDHILGNSFVARTWKLPLQTSAGEWAVYEQNRLWGQTYGLRMEPFAGDVSSPLSRRKAGNWHRNIGYSFNSRTQSRIIYRFIRPIRSCSLAATCCLMAVLAEPIYPEGALTF
jgi:glyoxylase-like metal-dependent hydrolase (beta-lactamase superfamily II)